MHTYVDALIGVARDGEQLDGIAELFRHFHIDAGYGTDSLHVHVVGGDAGSESDRGKNGDFRSCVEAVNVGRGVGFRVAQGLGLRERLFKGKPLVTHGRQNKIAGAVDDAGDPFDAVGGKAFAQTLDDRNAPCHGSFIRYGHSLFGCRRENFIAMQRKKRLIGRYDMLAGGNGFKHQTLGWLNAAHYFHDDVDFRIIDQIVPVFRERHSFVNDAASAINIAANHGLDFNGSTGSARKFLCVTLKNGIRAAPTVPSPAMPILTASIVSFLLFCNCSGAFVWPKTK